MSVPVRHKIVYQSDELIKKEPEIMVHLKNIHDMNNGASTDVEDQIIVVSAFFMQAFEEAKKLRTLV